MYCYAEFRPTGPASESFWVVLLRIRVVPPLAVRSLVGGLEAEHSFEWEHHQFQGFQFPRWIHSSVHFRGLRVRVAKPKREGFILSRSAIQP